ncbi:MAG: hypothetical protein JWP40_4736 [Blastococcus sp.]|jgi:hypothetical protein|nr:hypothetical protein [Blastococcus sp.]
MCGRDEPQPAGVATTSAHSRRVGRLLGPVELVVDVASRVRVAAGAV